MIDPIFRLLNIWLTEDLDCLRSLCFREMELRLQNICSSLDQTCEWLFGRHEYDSWINAESSSEKQAEVPGLLWIKGKPGAGKSTLMKTILKVIDLDKN